MNRTVRRWLTPAIAAACSMSSMWLGAPSPVRAAIPECFGSEATIVGTSGDDVIVGTAAFDVIVGLGGDDEIDGRGGIDRICGNAGDDVLVGNGGKDQLHGGADSDVLLGGGSQDRLFGGSGDDTLIGGVGSELYDGGGGADFVDFGGSTVAVTADLRERFAVGEGSDRITLVEGLVGTAFGDELFGDANPNHLIGGGGNDILHGRGDFDFAIFIFSRSEVVVDLEAQSATGEGTDDVLGIEGAVGSTHDDTLLGTAASNYLDGDDGFDTIDGRGGDDHCLNGENVSNCEPALSTSSRRVPVGVIRAAARLER